MSRALRALAAELKRVARLLALVDEFQDRALLALAELDMRLKEVEKRETSVQAADTAIPATSPAQT